MSSSITFHHARPEDDMIVRRLAHLDSARALRGEVVIARVDGWPVAAISLTEDRVVADPFVRSAHVVEMLRAYAIGVLTEGDRPGRRAALSPRPALAA